MLDPTNVQRFLNEIQHETSSSLAKKAREYDYTENILTVFLQRIQAPDLSETDVFLLEKALFILPNYALNSEQVKALIAFLEARGEFKNQSVLDSALLNSASVGNIEMCTMLLGKGANVNTVDKRNGMTPLLYASKAGDLKLVEMLQSKNADLKATDKEGVNALHYACESRDLLLVEFLLGQGFTINDKADNGTTPFHWACKGGSLKVPQFLIDQGASPLTRDNNGATAMHWACYGGQMHLFQFLKEKGLDISDVDNEGKTCLHYVCEGEWTESSETTAFVLIFEGVIDADNNGVTPLHLLCKSGNKKAVEYLLDFPEIKIAATDDEGGSCLTYACLSGNLELVQYLIEKGLDIASEDQSLLFSNACESEIIELIQFLLENGVDTEDYNEDGMLPIHYAGSKGKLKVVRFMIDNKYFDIAVANSEGETLMHYACQRGDKELVEYLLSKDLGFNVKDKYGNFPILDACNNQSSEFIEYLETKGANLLVKNNSRETVLHRACWGENFDVAVCLLKRGFSMFEADMDGDIPWHGIESPEFQMQIVEHLSVVDQELLKMLEAVDSAYQNPEAEERNKQAIQGIFSQWLKPGGEAIVERAFRIPQLVPHLFKYGGDFIKENLKDPEFENNLPFQVIVKFLPLFPIENQRRYLEKLTPDQRAEILDRPITLEEIQLGNAKEALKYLKNEQLPQIYWDGRIEERTPVYFVKQTLNNISPVGLVLLMDDDESKAIILECIRALSEDQISMITPILSNKEWIDTFHAIGVGTLKETIIRSSSPEQLKLLKVNDLIDSRYFALQAMIKEIKPRMKEEISEKEYDEIAERFYKLPLMQIQHGQNELWKVMTKLLDEKPEYKEWEGTFKDLQSKAKEMIKSIEAEHAPVLDKIREIGKPFEVEIPSIFIDPVSLELLEEDCYIDPTIDATSTELEHKYCNLESLSHGTSPISRQPITREPEELEPAPEEFKEKLRTLRRAEEEGSFALKQAIKDLEE